MTWCAGARALMLTAAVLAAPLAAENLPAIVPNDNRLPAGTLRGAVLTLRLEIAKGVWHPEREDGEAIPVYAFGESGKTLQVPGPAIRVPQGSTIDISLHNTLAVPATLHGLHQRPGDDSGVVTVAPGATEHVRFAAGAPGTYLYWARTPDGQRGNARVADSLLGGALVVDPPGGAAADRIFVLERWDGPTRTAIKGKSWPYTERLNYEVGERVHWRLINASDLSHPMHLHGFHFELDAEGDGEHYNVYAPGSQPLEFTHSVEIGETFEMTWVPKEPGRWLYHCHRIPHMRLPVPLDAGDVMVADRHEHMHEMDSGYDGMGGMIMGITVKGRSAIDTTTNWKPERRLELAVGERHGDPRYFELSLRSLEPDAARAKPRMSTGLNGPAIVLTQNQPVEINVVNKLKEPTSIHWHGIELESYYDGVPGWGGQGEKQSPAVAPGEAFTVRMAPPRAGTFMYHTHWHDAVQLTGGVHGALIVLPPGQTYDPATDKSFMFSQGANEPFGAAMILMNGVPQPATMRLKTETTYRFRVMNITPSVNNLRVILESGGSPVQWRPLAKDAAEVKAGTLRAADQTIGVGETFDFEYRTASPVELKLVGLSPNDNRRAVQTLIFSDVKE
jgi:FtsP/CotA-like multicopper oxidase with cupredoxin domain